MLWDDRDGEVLIGDFERAGRWVELAREVSSCSGFTDWQFDAGALIAALLICAERGRPGDADASMPYVASASTRSDWGLGLYSRAVISIISERSIEGPDLPKLCLRSFSRWTLTGPIVTISEKLRATILLRPGGAGAALGHPRIRRPNTAPFNALRGFSPTCASSPVTARVPSLPVATARL